MTTPNRPASLSNVQPGDQIVRQYGSGRKPVIVKKVWKNGIVEIEGDIAKYNPDGHERGEGYRGSYIRPFKTDETPESIAADEAAESDKRKQDKAAADKARQDRLAAAVERNAENIANMVTVHTPTWNETLNVLDYVDRQGERKTAVFIVTTKTEIDWSCWEERRTYQALEARVAGAGYERMYDMDSEGNTVAGQKYSGFSSWSSITGRTMDEIIAQICDW